MPRHPQSESAQAERSQARFSWYLVETENDGILITANSFRPYRSRWLQLKCSGDGAGGFYSSRRLGRNGSLHHASASHSGFVPENPTTLVHFSTSFATC